MTNHFQFLENHNQFKDSTCPSLAKGNNTIQVNIERKRLLISDNISIFESLFSACTNSAYGANFIKRIFFKKGSVINAPTRLIINPIK